MITFEVGFWGLPTNIGVEVGDMIFAVDRETRNFTETLIEAPDRVAAKWYSCPPALHAMIICCGPRAAG
jgi:hypothetical protein